MSLGQLLRRASSKASDLLTFNQSSGSSRILDGEIIYSKNNVCVHPSDVLRGLGEHHPGYLCIHLEKDELLGTTLIITWIPNTRIQRQDEEALRYITPESSPVRKVQRRRCRHTHASVAHQPVSVSGEKQELVPPEDDEIISVSEDMINSMHIGSLRSEQSIPLDSLALQISDGTLQQTHCDPQISSTVTSQDDQKELEIPAECQDEINSKREQGEDEASYDLTTDDVSRDSTIGSDSDTFSSPLCLSPVGDPLAESSRSVFLDAENSDEACTCGQLVIASRESQYKIFHFHHGGLDKLSEVFQQWKYCTETHQRDQVSDVKACMQFSIKRPNLPSSEIHPEENMYKRLDVTTWLNHLNEAGQVEEEYKLRKNFNSRITEQFSSVTYLAHYARGLEDF
ncbi:TBC1 domain family member 16-like isoform X2 [Rhincodon typus]|uniref:TBC1 domain family member 16-like isoform X2 n=1 Tax=Rhincodon typus TaxID=259920 RepID=UPI002030107F|nr:TBC1 domain family member 16-like isoform X2 [Rhincodon typus]